MFSIVFSFITLSNFIVAVSSVYKRDLTKVSFVSSSVIWVLELELSLFLMYIYSAVQGKSISPSNWSRFYKPNWFGMAKVGWGMLTPVIILILAWDQNLYWSFSFSTDNHYVNGDGVFLTSNFTPFKAETPRNDSWNEQQAMTSTAVCITSINCCSFY